MPDKAKQTIEKYIGQGLNQNQIAKALDLSRSMIYRILKGEREGSPVLQRKVQLGIPKLRAAVKKQDKKIREGKI